MTKVFISYERSAEALVRKVEAALVAAGHQVWTDAELPPHRAYSDVIEERLSVAEAVLVLWSAAAARSQWVRAEAEYARGRGKLVQASLDDTLPPLPFNQIQCAALAGWRGRKDAAAWRKVLASIGELGDPDAKPLPAPHAAANAKPPAARPTATRRTLVIGATAAAAAGLGASLWIWRRHAAPGKPPTVAVLPFNNLSSDPQLGYIADGLSEDIINVLAQAGGVRVMAQPSSFKFRGADKARAASALGAGYVLDGAVLRDGDRLRVDAHLADAKGEALWADSFVRTFSQGLRIEDEIANQVARALRFRLTTPAPPSIDPAVFELYLRAREAMRSPDPQVLRSARLMLQDVTLRAPDFAAGWLQMAKSCFRDDYVYPRADRDRWDQIGRAAAGKAMALDPSSGPAIALRAQIAPLAGQWTAIDDGQRRGLQLSPNDPELLLWRGWVLLNMGRLSAAQEAMQRARLQDPFEFWANTFLSWVLIYRKSFAEADAAIAANEKAFPGNPVILQSRFWLLLATGREADAASAVEAQAPKDQLGRDAVALLARAARASASGAAAAEREAAASQLLARAHEGVSRSYDALVLVGHLGLVDQAAELARSLYLRRGKYLIDETSDDYPERNAAYPHFLFHPLTEPLRRSGALREVFDGIGLTSFWQAKGRPDPDLGIA